MRIGRPLLLLAVAAVAMMATTGCGGRSGRADEIVVFAAASLTDAFSDLGAAFTEIDPDTSVNDGFFLSGAVATVRTKGFTLPGSPAEAATFLINGAVVATSVPDMRLAQLQTDSGVLPALVFTASGASLCP